MPIKAILTENDFSAIDESVQGLYSKIEDEKHPRNGEYVLDVEGVDGWQLDDVKGLKTALDKERQARKLADDNAKRFDGLDPNDVQQKLKQLDELSKFDPDQEADKRAEAKVQAIAERMESDLKAKDRSFQEQLKQREELVVELENQLRGHIIDSAANGIAGRLSESPDLILPHIREQLDIRVRDDGRRDLVVVDSKTRSVRSGRAYDSEMTLEELEKEISESTRFSPLVRSLQRGGSGAPSATGGSRAPAGPARLADAKTPEEREAWLKRATAERKARQSR